MMFVAGENLLPILVALLIGFITGLWVWKFARKVVVKPDREPTGDAPLRRPYVDGRSSPVALEEDLQPFPAPRPEPEVLARRGAAGGATLVSPGPAAVPAATAAGDDLQVMKGVGPKLASLLREQGITRYDQIAALSADDLTRLDAHLGAFRGRLTRDRIVEQAAFLAAGDREGYEKEFGRL